MKSTHVIEADEISGLIPKLFHNWMVICFFRQVKAKFTKGEGKGTSGGVTANCKVLFKCSIDAIGTIVSFEGNSSGIKVELLNKVFETMRITWDIGTCSNPKANHEKNSQ